MNARLWVSEIVADACRFACSEFGRPGSDLLSHVLRRSTIGAEGFHGRVRDGIGCLAPRHNHQVIGTQNLTSRYFEVLSMPRHALDQASGAISTG